MLVDLDDFGIFRTDDRLVSSIGKDAEIVEQLMGAEIEGIVLIIGNGNGRIVRDCRNLCSQDLDSVWNLDVGNY